MNAIKKVVFVGSKKLGLNCLKSIYNLKPDVLTDIITLDDSKDSRSILKDFEAFAKEKSVNFHIALNRKNFEEIIHEIKPDLGVVIGWYWLLTKEILDFIPAGVVGIHASALPKYRGGAPLVWAMINGENKAGISFFKFDEGMDSGDLIGQEIIKIEIDDTIAQVIQKAEEASLKLINNSYLSLIDQTIKYKKQSTEGATYCAQRNSSDGLIDWHKSAFEVYNFIRAQTKPYPGAFIMFKDKKLIIWEVELAQVDYSGTPGQVVNVDHQGVLVICGDNKPVLLRQVQFENEDEQLAQEAIKSISVRFNI